MNRIWADLVNSFSRRDNALTQIIIINVVVFVLVQLCNVAFSMARVPGYYEAIVNGLSLPAEPGLFLRQPWSLFTYFFFHTDIWHIFWNMIMFYWFGQVLEMLGHGRRITAIYIYGGIMGGLIYMGMYNAFPQTFNPMGMSPLLIGASGAIYAVVVAAATQSPDYRFNLLFLGPVKIVYLAGAYVLLSFLSITRDNPGGNLAHLGGALMGFVYMTQLQRGNDWARPVLRAQEFVAGLFRRRRPMRVSYQNPVAIYTGTNDSPTKTSRERPTLAPQDEIDAILDKISKVGYQNLTKDERDKLNSASSRL